MSAGSGVVPDSKESVVAETVFRREANTVRVKICGITRIEDAEAAIAAGAAMLGLNFYAPSPRCITLERAQQIARAVAGRVPLVGVFVNAEVGELLRIAREVPLHAVQLHGEEPAEACQAVAREFPVIRALKAGPDCTPERVAAFAPCRALLIDTPTPQYGGSGEAFDWNAVDWAGLRRALPQAQLWLAGGLHAGSVARAVAVARPDVVDVCSGVESGKGIKSVEKMRSFVAAVRAAESEER
jgi:phosphoribosylanthranilate isomerase